MDTSLQNDLLLIALLRALRGQQNGDKHALQLGIASIGLLE